MLAGEYAVLYGAPALVMAVDRHAVVSIAETPAPMPREVEATLALALAEDVITTVPAMALDVSALHGDGARKLGLGSSAAACVAALGLALAWEGRPLDRAVVATLARRGHRRAQGGGSGVDVLASALGGVVRAAYPRGLDGAGDVSMHAGMGALPWAVLWSGTPARTSEMIARVDAMRVAAPETFTASIGAIVAATEAVAEALRAQDARAMVAAVAAHHAAMARLGERAGVAVVTDAMARLATALEPVGAAVKPSGAGGGDVVVLVAQDGDALDEAVARGAAEGFVRVHIETDDAGVALR